MHIDIGLTSEGEIGLFGVVIGGKLINIELSNVNIIGGSRAGGLVARATDSEIFYCRVLSGVMHTDRVDTFYPQSGGVVASLRSSSTIRNCLTGANLEIIGINRVGGIIGNMFGGTSSRGLAIANKSEALVTGRRTNTSANGIGGFVGLTNYDDVENNYSTGNVTITSTTTTSTGQAAFTGQQNFTTQNRSTFKHNYAS